MVVVNPDSALLNGVASKKLGWGQKFWAPKCVTLGEQRYFCLGLRFSKHKMTRYVKNWRIWPPGYAYGCTVFWESVAKIWDTVSVSQNTKTNFSRHNKIWGNEKICGGHWPECLPSMATCPWRSLNNLQITTKLGQISCFRSAIDQIWWLVKKFIVELLINFRFSQENPWLRFVNEKRWYQHFPLMCVFSHKTLCEYFWSLLMIISHSFWWLYRTVFWWLYRTVF